MVQDEVCPLCCNGVENILYALRDCIKLKQVWNQLGVNASNLDFWHFNLIDWLSLIGRSNIKMHDMSLPWKMVFPIAIWNIWKSRNAFIFSGKARSPNLVVEIVCQANEYLHCMASPRLEIRKITRYIRWERPEHGWKKLNTDGACMGHHGLAGYGGLVRSADGQLLGSASGLGSPLVLPLSCGVCMKAFSFVAI